MRECVDDFTQNASRYQVRGVVVGARGAVGSEVVAELQRGGHEVLTVGRSASQDVRVDLTKPQDIARLGTVLQPSDVLINASGQERPELADLVAFAPIVDISATGRYLSELATRIARITQLNPSQDRPVAVLGAGIAPGLSTVLLSELQSTSGDALDLGVTLGAGERHGAEAVEWTLSLLGTDMFAPPESAAVRNLREARKLPGLGGVTRTHLRADFPDHVLLGARQGTPVRSYLALSSPMMTLAMRLLGRVPKLGGLMRVAPAIGSEDWRIVALNRRTGEQISVEGSGQSRATGILAAVAAERLAERIAQADASPMPHRVQNDTGVGRSTTNVLNMADLCTADELAARLGGQVLRS
ncbi:NAD-dependent epimerase/dehydratase family protein [Leucobacter sp. 1207-22]